MTREEAIKILEENKPTVIFDDEDAQKRMADIWNALDMAIKALETIPKYKDAYNKGWDDGAKASYEHLKMCEEEQDGDMISRDAVIDITWEEPSYTDALNVLTEVRDKVKALPSVNPQPQTGHWIRMKAYEKWRCSECNTVFRFTFKEHDYCPNCGCKMSEIPTGSESEG